MVKSTVSPPLVFTFSSNTLRVILREGEPWFVAADVAAALEYRDATNLVRILDDDEKDTHNVSTLGGNQDFIIINESGLYSAILKSRKSEAKKFKKWVTSEVLPSIRKTGGYYTGQDSFREHAAALRSLAETASAFANAASALAAKYEPYVVASPSHNTTTTVQKIIPVLSPIPPREQAFIHAWWECFGTQTVTASDLYRAIATKQCQILNDSSAALLGDVALWTPKKLSHALRRWSQLALDGYRVQNIGKSSHGITWRLELLAAGVVVE